MVFPGVLRGLPGPRLATTPTNRPRRSLSSPGVYCTPQCSRPGNRDPTPAIRGPTAQTRMSSCSCSATALAASSGWPTSWPPGHSGRGHLPPRVADAGEAERAADRDEDAGDPDPEVEGIHRRILDRRGHPRPLPQRDALHVGLRQRLELGLGHRALCRRADRPAADVGVDALR